MLHASVGDQLGWIMPLCGLQETCSLFVFGPLLSDAPQAVSLPFRLIGMACESEARRKEGEARELWQFSPLLLSQL